MKRLIIPAIVLIAIGLAWLIQSRLENKRIRGKTIDNFLEINSEDISRIDVSAPDDTLVFRLDGGHWFVTIYSLYRRADTMAVRNMIRTAVDLKVGNVISQNAERRKDFMVDDTGGNLVQFYRDDRLLSEIIIGKPANDYSHTYIRKPGDDEVYLADGLITFVYRRQKTQWLDKTIFSFAPGSINSVEFDLDRKTYRLWRGDSAWFIGERPYLDSALADSVKTSLFIGTIVNLVANDFVNAADSGLINFDSPSLNLKVSLVDGTTRSLTFAAVNDETNRVFCRTPEYSDTFVLYRSKFDNLKKDLTGF
ncbi:MAG: hypothetical protein CVT49_06355 [candidate division Zixibacteria bacterium HGW-Zixibacteria-1]|nr:MAG: hypothetical protein CVT49_06355 [candidate division Zixibacteria bacterium HGW-Zixibacteria-1]